jgi:hypothetical protein
MATAKSQAPSKSKKKLAKEPAIQRVQQQDPFSAENMKQLAVRIGLPVLGFWVLGGCIAGFSQSRGVLFWAALALPLLVTLAAAGLVGWMVSQAKKAKGVANILSTVETAEDRKAALEKLEAGYGKNDPAAIFAKSQLLMQEDPKKALAALEQIDLTRVMAPVADQARAQRAMLHLLLGEVTPARDLADGIDLSRHQNVTERAMMAAVVSEAWARTGQAKKAVETVELYNPDEDIFDQVRPQLHRARAFVYAATGDVKAMRRSLKKLADQDARILAGFLGKRTHPLMQKEAKKMLEQSGQVPRRMQVQRH